MSKVLGDVGLKWVPYGMGHLTGDGIGQHLERCGEA